MEIDKIEICKEYVNTNIGIEALAKKYHVGKLKIKAILTEAGVEFKKRGQQQSKEVFVVNDWRIEKYPEVEGKHYVAVDKNTGFETADYNNRAGVLTTHINKEYGVEIPTLYDRRKYYMLTGDYWWEQWFEIKIIDDKPTKKCPYCGWETVDVENRSGAFEQHLQSEHNMSVKDYLQEHPEDLDYFPKYKKEKEHRDNLNLDCGYVVCPICGQRFERISPYHLKYRHGMTWGEFIEKYPKTKVISEINVEQAKESQKLANLTVSKDRFISKYEKELQDFLNENNIEFEPNRQILIGKEIDILIPSLKLGIEFNGLKFHTEFFGKKAHRYHLDKTVQCNEKGYKLIHIFEDEFVNHKEIVYNKLRHAIGLNRNLPKVGGRKCEVKTIYSNDAKTFLNENHIQGFSSSSVYYGAFYNNELVAVMSFKNGTLKSPYWELTRFATSPKYQYQGVASKMFKRFLNDYHPTRVSSFADRRWTTDINSNLYTKLGFELEKVGGPDYHYYNEKIEKFKRFHKMSLNKKKLIKKYGFVETMTELEMARALGYDRIWDCGLIKYVYYNEN